MLPNRSLQVISPANGERNTNLSPPVIVKVLRDGFLDAGLVAGQITLSLISPDPVLYPGLLAGTKVAEVNAGVITFSPLSVNVPGPYTLRATAENANFVYIDDSTEFWQLNLPSNAPASLLDFSVVGYWINIVGTGVPFGIWAKIIDVRKTPGNHWILEQHKTGPTSLSALQTMTGNMSVRYNSATPMTPPATWTGIGTDVWFLWDPLGGENILPFTLTPLVQTLTTDVALPVLRNISVEITTWPTEALTGANESVLAVIRNQDGNVATDIDQVQAAVEIRSGATAVHTTSATVVNGNIFVVLPMPATAGTYSIWVSYQGTWYQATQATDQENVVVTAVVEPPPPVVVPPAPIYPEEYELQAGGCAVNLHVSSYLELEAADTFIKVLVK